MMTSKRRWMQWVLTESAKPQPVLPWQRGVRPVTRPVALIRPVKLRLPVRALQTP